MVGCSRVQCVDTLLAALWSGLGCCPGDWWISGVYWLEKKRKERVTRRCVSGEGGYDRLSNSPQDTSHTSLAGSGKENGSYVSAMKVLSHTRAHTYTHKTHTHFYPNYPYPVPWADGLSYADRHPSRKCVCWGGGGESQKRGMEGRSGEGEKWWKGESWGSSEGGVEKGSGRIDCEGKGNHITRHEAEWNMCPCHLPHTVNGWPPQSCHQRLISAARKWIKGWARRREGG